MFQPYRNLPFLTLKLFESCISSTTWTNGIGGKGYRRESSEPSSGTE